MHQPFKIIEKKSPSSNSTFLQRPVLSRTETKKHLNNWRIVALLKLAKRIEDSKWIPEPFWYWKQVEETALVDLALFSLERHFVTYGAKEKLAAAADAAAMRCCGRDERIITGRSSLLWRRGRRRLRAMWSTKMLWFTSYTDSAEEVLFVLFTCWRGVVNWLWNF